MSRVVLKLFVFGQSPPSLRAIAGIGQMCRDYGEACRLEVVDVAAEPDQAERYNILAIPTLLRTSPEPVRRIIGDLADCERLVRALELEPEAGG